MCNVFASQPTQDEQGLLAAAQIAGRLLIAGAQAAPEGARFFQAVGRAMVLEDGVLSGGAHHAAIRDAFAGHQIAIGSTAMLAPTSGLSGAPPTVNRATGRASLSAGVRRDLLKRIGGRGRLSVKGIEIGGQAVAKAIHRRSVSLEKLDRRLKSVTVSAVESVLVGSSAARAVVLDRLPDASTTVDEVHHFVATLLEHGVVAMKTIRRGARRKTARSAARVFRLTTSGHAGARRCCSAFASRAGCDRRGVTVADGQGVARRRAASSVAGSAGKKDSIRSSWSVMSWGVPRLVSIEK